MILWSVAELHEHLDDQHLRVVDVRWTLGQPGAGRAAYDVGHIPGAIHVDMDTDLADQDGFGAPGRHPLPDPVAFATRLGALGIGTDDTVVAYDDARSGSAARLWWMLDDLGHRDVHLLDGGIGAWTAAALPLTTDVLSWPPATLALASRWSRVIDRETLTERLGSVVLLDARAPERYRGEVEPIDPVAGHIPTALNAPTGGNLGQDGHFLASEALAARFAGLGIGGPEPGRTARSPSDVAASKADLARSGSDIVTSCGSGITACQNAIAMRVAGLPAPLVYIGSYSDWSRSGMPVATGPEPGEPPT
jgi:thiosulfate/3-mercaptopyruvate sulfurtransferase